MGWFEDNELRPDVQNLVDRFGQAQTFEILMALAHSVCPDGGNKNFWITVRMGRL